MPPFAPSHLNVKVFCSLIISSLSSSCAMLNSSFIFSSTMSWMIHCAPDNSPDYWPSWCRWQRGYSVTAALSSPSPCLQKSTQWLCGKQSLGSKRMQCVLKNSRRKCWSSQKAWWELQLKQNLLVHLFVGTSPFAFYPLLPEKCPSWSSLSISSSFSLSF